MQEVCSKNHMLNISWENMGMELSAGKTCIQETTCIKWIFELLAACKNDIYSDTAPLMAVPELQKTYSGDLGLLKNFRRWWYRHLISRRNCGNQTRGSLTESNIDHRLVLEINHQMICVTHEEPSHTDLWRGKQEAPHAWKAAKACWWQNIARNPVSQPPGAVTWSREVK